MYNNLKFRTKNTIDFHYKFFFVFSKYSEFYILEAGLVSMKMFKQLIFTFWINLEKNEGFQF